MISFRGVACLGLGVALSWPGPTAALGQGPETAAELVQRLKVSTEAIRTVRASYRTYFAPDGAIAPKGPLPGMERGPGDLILYSEFDWSWQAGPYREAIDGRWGFTHEGRFRYTDAAFAFDGSVLRTLTREGRQGLVKRLDETFTVWRNPLFLIGVGLCIESPGPGETAPRVRDLTELLGEARVVTLPETPPHVRVIRGAFRQGPAGKEVTAWLDTRRACLPVRIEVFEGDRNFLDLKIVNDAFWEAQPGVWVPTRGAATLFAVTGFHFPDGLTREQVARLPPREISALLRRSLAVTQPLGFGTQTYVVDEATLQVNHPIPAARFVIEPPEGTTLLDTTRVPPLQYKVKAGRPPAE